jgi:hypothetical protein
VNWPVPPTPPVIFLLNVREFPAGLEMTSVAGMARESLDQYWSAY